jgi:hypothetical protein
MAPPVKIHALAAHGVRPPFFFPFASSENQTMARFEGEKKQKTKELFNKE